MKTALITGITGQDGSYLAENLLEKGYEVHGIKRRTSVINTKNIDHIFGDIQLHYGDLTDATGLMRIISQIEPDEIYNIGAQSHVKVSFDTPEYTTQTDAVGPLYILEAVKTLGLTSKIYQASTSELYGKVQEVPQTETTPFYPRSPYGVAKLYAYWITKNYRESYGMFASNGILFNHESPRRGETFVSRKITMGVSAIYKGRAEELVLGNLSAKRDWGHAKDYVEGMRLILNHDLPDDFVLATGEMSTVRSFVSKSFSYIGKRIEWEGEGLDEKGYCGKTGKCLVRVSSDYYRPAEVDQLLGDPSKAKRVLGWFPKHNLDDLIEDMMMGDLK